MPRRATTTDLWESGIRPALYRTTHGVDEWLTLIASGHAIGISSEATRAQHPQPGIVFRLLGDTPPSSVWLTWRRHDPPPGLEALVEQHAVGLLRRGPSARRTPSGGEVRTAFASCVTASGMPAGGTGIARCWPVIAGYGSEHRG